MWPTENPHSIGDKATEEKKRKNTFRSRSSSGDFGFVYRNVCRRRRAGSPLPIVFSRSGPAARLCARRETLDLIINVT